MLVSVVTPDASYFDGEADRVTLPASDGLMGVLPRHAPAIARLGHGVTEILHGGKTTRIAVYGGFVKIQDDVVTVLAGGAAKSDEGDLKAAEKALQEAEAELSKVSADVKAAPADVELASERVARAQAYRDLLSA